jgi:hypothetical protein
MTGIALEAAGLDVDIYERFPKSSNDRGTDIVMQAETKTFAHPVWRIETGPRKRG